eukprot:2898553-Prymnesium_polylepis.1
MVVSLRDSRPERDGCGSREVRKGAPKGGSALLVNSAFEKGSLSALRRRRARSFRSQNATHSELTALPERALAR